MTSMDLVNAAINLKHAEVTGQIQYAVARKLLDSQRQQGDAAIKLIEAASAEGAAGGDQLVAAATGLGGQLDTYG